MSLTFAGHLRNDLSPEARFWVRVEKTRGCWNWLGTKNSEGYGELVVEGQQVGAHRFAYELLRGKIPGGMTIDHLCGNPSCINPDHLEVATMKENILRGNGLGAKNAKKTQCPRGHALREGNLSLSELARGRRSCLVCRRMHQREAYYRRKARLELVA